MTLYIPGLGDLMDYELSYHDIHAKNIMKVAGDIKRRTMPAAAMYYDTDSCIRYYLNPNTKTQETTGYQINTIKPIFHREKINKIYKILLDEMYPGYKYNCTLELFIQFAKSHYLKPYCQWCSSQETPEIKHIIEHSHIIPSFEIDSLSNKPKYWIGKYRGKLCMRCNALESVVKTMNTKEKIEYLKRKGFDEYSAIVIIDKWYHK